jgi:hypothetical protein
MGRFFSERWTMGKKKSDAFVKTSKKRFEVADASEVRLGVGGNFRAEQIGTLGAASGNVE